MIRPLSSYPGPEHYPGQQLQESRICKNLLWEPVDPLKETKSVQFRTMQGAVHIFSSSAKLNCESPIAGAAPFCDRVQFFQEEEKGLNSNAMKKVEGSVAEKFFLQQLGYNAAFFLKKAAEDISLFSHSELEKGWEESLNFIKHQKIPLYQTTIVQIAEIISSHKILVFRDLKRAMQIRMQTAAAIPPTPSFARLGSELSKVNSPFGLHLQPFGATLVKNHAFVVQKKKYRDGTVRIQLDAKLKLSISEKYSLDVLLSWMDQKGLLHALPPHFCHSVTITKSDAAYEGLENHPNEDGMSCFSHDISKYGYVIKLENQSVKRHVIDFEGIGTIMIGNDPRCISEYGHLSISLDPQVTEDEAAGKLHLLLAIFGVGTLSSESRPEDIERKKILLFFRAFYPRESTELEKAVEVFHISIQKLKHEIIQKVPEMQEKFDRDLAGMYQQEIYPAHSVWAVPGLANEVKAAGGWGLMSGLRGDFHSAKALLMKILKIGFLSTQDRLIVGCISLGASAKDDLLLGGAESVFTRLITSRMPKNLDQYDLHGHVQILFDLKLVERTGHCYQSDRNGSKEPIDYDHRPSILALTQEIETSQNPESYADNEVCIRHRIPPEYIKGILVPSEKERDQLIQAMEEENLIDIYPQLGKFYRNAPIDNFIHIGNFKKSYWNHTEIVWV